MTTNEKNETTDRTEQTFGGKLEGHYERLWRDECEAGAEIRRQRDLALAQVPPPEKLVLSMIERIASRMGGTTLAEAEKNFLQGVSEKENPKPRSLDPELQALLDAARTEKGKKP